MTTDKDLFVVADADGALYVWRGIGPDDPACRPILARHTLDLQDPVLWPILVAALGAPLPDSETEWGWDPDSEFPGDVIVAVDEAAARERAGAARGRLLMQRRAPGPWIEVTS